MKTTDCIRVYASAGQPITISASTALELCDLADKAQRDEAKQTPEYSAAFALGRFTRWLIIYVMAVATATVLLWAWRLVT